MSEHGPAVPKCNSQVRTLAVGQAKTKPIVPVSVHLYFSLPRAKPHAKRVFTCREARPQDYCICGQAFPGLQSAVQAGEHESAMVAATPAPWEEVSL